MKQFDRNWDLAHQQLDLIESQTTKMDNLLHMSPAASDYDTDCVDEDVQDLTGTIESPTSEAKDRKAPFWLRDYNSE